LSRTCRRLESASGGFEKIHVSPAMLRQALHDHQAEERVGERIPIDGEGLFQSDRGSGYGSAGDPAATTSAGREDRVRRGGAGGRDIEDGPNEEDADGEGQPAVYDGGHNEDDGDHDVEDDDEDEDDDEEDEDEDEDEDDDPPRPVHVRLWQTVKAGIRIVANVENLWDDSVTPDSSTSSSSRRRRRDDPGAGGVVDDSRRTVADAESRSRYQRDLELHLRDSVSSQHHYPFYFRTRNLIVLFWFVVLASSYAAERSTYKLLVDRAGPFRLFAVEMVTFTHSVMLLTSVLLAKFVKDPTPDSSGRQQHSRYVPPPSPHHAISLGISIIDVALMALLESIQLILVFLTGLHVPPTLTVILIQFTLPLTAFLTQFVHPQGRCNCSPNAAADSDGTTNGNAHASAVDATPPPPPPPGDPYLDSSYRNAASDHRNDETDRLLSQGYQFASSTEDDDHDNAGAESGTRRSSNTCGGLSSEHVYGSLIIFLAVVLALIPAFYSIARPDFFDYAGASKMAS
jgi:hypothetical protein